eukprot:877897-Pelagomonas_calceolata.AAC.1
MAKSLCTAKAWQFHWLRATVEFFNSLLESNSEALRRVLKADLNLANSEESCWSAHVSKSFNGMRNEDMFTHNAECFQDPHAGFQSGFEVQTAEGHQTVWREMFALSPRE